MSKTDDDLRSDFLLNLRDAIDKKRLVVLIAWSKEDDEWSAFLPGDKAESDAILNTIETLPFIGKMTLEDAFEMWDDYYDDTALAEIFGFELEDGQIQISILE